MTKVILTGATGTIGSQVLKTAITDPRITSLIVLSRRELPEPTKDLATNDPKVKLILHKDFQKYPPELLEQLQGATACIWCIGGMVRDFDNAATARKVQVTYAVAAAEAFIQAGIAPLTFVFCSGAWAERQQDKELWYLEETRKIKGEAEASLAALAESTPSFTPYYMRLGGVLPANTAGNLTAGLLGWTGPVVRLEQVAAVFIEVALKGYQKSILENGDIVAFEAFEDGGGRRRRGSVWKSGSGAGSRNGSVDAGRAERPEAERRRSSILMSFGRKGSKVGKVEG